MNESPRVLGNRYEVGDLLGRGGMAEVHLGRDTRLGRTVAIKLLRTDLARDPTFQARFRREAQSAAALNHPAIVAVYDTSEETITDATGSTVALPYIVMEYVQGRTLRDLIEAARARVMNHLPPGSPPPPSAGALEVEHALEVTSGILSALEYSHRAGIVHRDIKPANVMLTTSGDVKVMDFGIARALADASATMTQTQAVIGTAQYLSPEQARGESVDARSDLYSTGCLLFELLTGRPPFVADSPVAVAYQHVKEFPQPPSAINPKVPEAVDRIVMHALTKDRDIRYQTASEFREDVEAARRGGGVGAPAMTGGQAAVTEYIAPEGATRAMPASAAAGAGAAAGFAAGSILPGGAATQDPYDYSTGGYQTAGYPPGGRPPAIAEEKKNRGWMYAIIALALLAVAGIIGFLVANPPADPDTIQVPSVRGLTASAAQDLLTADGFTVNEESEASATVAKGLVTRQSPEASTPLAKGSEVTIWVSTGPDSVTVPQDVVGKTQAEARTMLEAVGLKAGDAQSTDITVEIVQANGGDLFEQGTVMRTEPAAGTTVAPATVVTLFVSSGNVVVPDVTDSSQEDARQVLEQTLDLRVRVVAQESDRRAGTVIDQNPAAGSKVAMGSQVTLTVAKPKPTPTPTPTTPTPTATDTPTGTPTGTPTTSASP